MEMTLRWYGEGYDSVTLNQIRQIPGVTGVISTLYGTQPGEEWKDEEIKKLKSQVETAGLHLSGIESVNIADEIKTGDSTRDLYIERYIRTLEKLGQNDIHMVCYNFMPVFDWTRSDLAKPRPIRSIRKKCLNQWMQNQMDLLCRDGNRSVWKK